MNSRSTLTPLEPPGWPRPKGYANGILAEGRMVFVGGQIGWDTEGRFPPDFAGQIRQTFENIRAVLAAGGAGPEHLVRLTWYVTDIRDYEQNLAKIGRHYREVFGKNFPAMAVVAVSRLVEPQAKVEIEATAVIPSST
jgi:enamine deaminase RidA (YjgF/YER057c/UK114 family)